MNKANTYLATGLVAVLLMSIGATAQASPGRGFGGWEPPTIEERVARLTEELDLDDAQAAEVLDVLTAADAERETLKAQIHTDICALASSVSEQVKAVLTPAQSEDLDKMMAHRAARREEFAASHGMDHMPPPPDCDDPGL